MQGPSRRDEKCRRYCSRRSALSDKRRERLAQIAAYSIVAFAFLGIAVVIYFIVVVVIGVANTTGVSAEITAAWESVTKGFGEHGPEMTTAVATVVLAVSTVLLWRATGALTRSTNVQFAVDDRF